MALGGATRFAPPNTRDFVRRGTDDPGAEMSRISAATGHCLRQLLKAFSREKEFVRRVLRIHRDDNCRAPAAAPIRTGSVGRPNSLAVLSWK
jgi:hypothetical protein